MELDGNFLTILRDQLGDMAEGFIRMLPQLAVGIVILLLTWLVAKGGRKIARKLTGTTEIRPSLLTLIETFVTIAIWIVGVFATAAIILPGVTPGSILAGLGLGAVAIGFAFQDIFENFFAGILIMLREKMRIGDVIECEGISGKVEAINLRETYIRKLSNEVTVVPNAMLFKNPVEIFTDAPGRRHEVVAGVSYDTDLDEAARVIEDAVRSCEKIDADRGIDVFAKEFNSSSVDFLVRWWSGSKPRDGHESRDAVVRAIKRALDEAGIEIPFPYVTHTFKQAVPLESAE
ncbi:mechanosensitive ion channel family protein [Parasphingopyxis marina]|uniref:Small-conductance mechanosensitive channel n=1 Tax=Parasphingopyxis marina TaxID=2761622 RepID=A0A842HTS3_9SPHN|nr:mechanosensitive ion channel [Parasphingopyxis marina]MBC2776422.1 mechanosensitive ion channel [Parasphingopyxis marina]